MYAWCRAIYAGVLVAMGDWERAERELVHSLRTYETVGGIGSRVLALARLAELRLRQGRTEEAERLLGGYEEHPLALVPLAELRVLAGEAATAAALLERRLEAVSDESPAAAPVLAGLVRARLACGGLESAAAAAAQLHALAARLGRDNLRALADLAAGDVALATADSTAAPSFERALARFVEVGMPYEAGRARAGLAAAYAAQRPELAVEEGRGALAAFERLGARRDADEAAALLRSLGASGRTAAPGGGELTGREREVLALLAEGLSNAEIARRLVISEKTAGHHVSRVLRKVGVRNRAEAAAFALRESLGARDGR